jgi:hypothetical protein
MVFLMEMLLILLLKNTKKMAIRLGIISILMKILKIFKRKMKWMIQILTLKNHL